MFSVRAVRPDDRSALLSLFSEAFGHPCESADWAWKYDANPCRSIAVAAFDGDGALGFFGGMGTRYRGEDGTFPGNASGDIMTSRRARQLGRHNVFAQVGDTHRLLNAGIGVPFDFGFPHERSRQVVERILGFRGFGPVGQLWRPLFRGGLLSRLRRRFLREVRREPFGAAHAPLAEALHGRAGWRTERSAEVLTWRLSRPGVTYRTTQLVDGRGESRGYAVVRVVGERGVLVDLQLADERSGELGDLLDAVSLDLDGTGATKLELRAPPSGLLARRAREEFGFAAGPSDTTLEVRAMDGAVDLERAGNLFDYRALDHDVF